MFRGHNRSSSRLPVCDRVCSRATSARFRRAGAKVLVNPQCRTGRMERIRWRSRARVRRARSRRRAAAVVIRRQHRPRRRRLPARSGRIRIERTRIGRAPSVRARARPTRKGGARRSLLPQPTGTDFGRSRRHRTMKVRAESRVRHPEGLQANNQYVEAVAATGTELRRARRERAPVVLTRTATAADHPRVSADRLVRSWICGSRSRAAPPMAVRAAAIALRATAGRIARPATVVAAM